MPEGRAIASSFLYHFRDPPTGMPEEEDNPRKPFIHPSREKLSTIPIELALLSFSQFFILRVRSDSQLLVVRLSRWLQFYALHYIAQKEKEG